MVTKYSYNNIYGLYFCDGLCLYFRCGGFFREHEDFFFSLGCLSRDFLSGVFLVFCKQLFSFFFHQTGGLFLVKDLLASLGLWRESFPFSEDVWFASAPIVDLSLRSFHEQSLFLSVLDFRQLIR